MPEDKKLIKPITPEDEFEDIAIDTPVKLSGKQKQAFATECVNEIKQSMEETGSLYNKLVTWGNLVDGISEQPSTGKSNVFIPVPNSKLTGVVDKISETINEIKDVYMFQNDQMPKEKIQAIQQRFRKNLESIDYRMQLEGLLWNAGEQRTAIAALTYDREVIRATKYETYNSIEEFKKEYPSWRSAKTTKQRYKQTIKNIKEFGGERVEVGYNRIKEKPKIDIINRQDFILCPANSRTIKEASSKYNRIYLTEQDFAKGAKSGKYEQEDIDGLRKKIDKENPTKGQPKKIEGSQDDGTANESAKQSVIGINPTVQERRESFTGIKQYDLDGDGIKEDVLVTIDYKAEWLINVREYPYFSGEPYYKKLVLRNRVNRFDGMGLIELLEHLAIQLNTLYNDRNNYWGMALSKTFLKMAGVEFNPALGDEGVELGLTYDVQAEDVRKVLTQLFQDMTGIPNFIQEELQILKYIDDITVSDQLLTGRESPTDPSAPMGKTLALMRMAASKIAGYIRHLRPGLNDIGEGLLWLEYQFGPDEYMEVVGGEEVTFTKDDLFPDNLNIEISVSDARLNQAILKQMALEALSIVQPLIPHNPLGQQELIDNFLKEAQFSGDRKIVTMTQEELMQLLTAEMQRQQQEQAAQEQQAQQEQQKELGKEYENITKDMTPEEVQEAESEAMETL